MKRPAPEAPAAESPVVPPEHDEVRRGRAVPERRQGRGLHADVVVDLTRRSDGQGDEDAGAGARRATASTRPRSRPPSASSSRPRHATGSRSRALISSQYSLHARRRWRSPPPRSAPPRVTGNLGGVIRMTGAEHARSPARSVAVTGPDGKQHRVTTDETGKWTLAGLPSGQVQRARRGAGVLTARRDRRGHGVGEATEVTYRLAPEAEGGHRGHRRRRAPAARGHEAHASSGARSTRIPGTNGDALRSLQNLPGVARAPGARAACSSCAARRPRTRRSSSTARPCRSSTTSAACPASCPPSCSTASTSTRATSARSYGRAMGGIVDVGLREPDTHCNGDVRQADRASRLLPRPGAGSTSSTRALLVQGPHRHGLELRASRGRRSWVDAWLKPVLESRGRRRDARRPSTTTTRSSSEDRATQHVALQPALLRLGRRARASWSPNPTAQDPGSAATSRLGTRF